MKKIDLKSLIFGYQNISEEIYQEIEKDCQDLIDKKEDLYDEIYGAVEKDKELTHKFVSFENAWSDLCTEEQENAYIIGFRHGVKLLFEILGENDDESDRHQTQSE